MTEGALFGGSVIAALVAGMIALFAPCCIGVMLPAYFAAAFQNQRRRIAMTFLFTAGVATVILPIALGAAIVMRIVNADHLPLYLGGGVLLIGLALYTLAGGHINLPTPSASVNGSGPLAVYTLGIFSGAATSCCTPVLAGLVTLAGLSASLLGGIGLGLAYVIGMVAPLFVMSLLWDSVDWRRGPLRPRRLRWRVGPITRTVGTMDLASAGLLLLMGAGSIWVALTGMPRSGGWQQQVSVTLQGIGQAAIRGLSFLPNWLAAGLLTIVVLALGWLALAQVGLARSRAGRTTSGGACHPIGGQQNHGTEREA